ncbi:growth/differentiatio [Synchiropus picturatus]
MAMIGHTCEDESPQPVDSGCFRMVPLLLLVVLSGGRSLASAASSPLHSLELSHYGSIFSPLLKALSEHGGSWWDPGSKKKMKPEQKYMKYLTEVYKKSSRVHRSLEGSQEYNTVRLIKPLDECLATHDRENFMQDLSYSIDQVRKKEELLKSALLYNSHPVHSMCFLTIREQERSDRCQLCPGIHRAVNFTASGPGRRNWVEVDVTSLLLPLLKFQKRTLRLLINVTCPEEKSHRGNGCLETTMRSPPLLLYLNDTSKVAHQRSHVKMSPRSAAENVIFKSDQRLRRKSRWKRESSKSKQGSKSLDIHLPELLSSSEYPTSDCALYDIKVRFSQLKLDHWIVFPPKYNPRYCRGICPRTISIYGSPVHTMVQNIIYERLDSSVPRPSCIPSHYSPLSVMIFEEDGSYVYKEFEDMIATRCTCR